LRGDKTHRAIHAEARVLVDYLATTATLISLFIFIVWPMQWQIASLNMQVNIDAIAAVDDADWLV
jgi:hypothetical protein